MLRITIENNPTTRCFIIEGRLEGAHVSELENCWQKTTSTASDSQFQVNLTGMTFVDAGGKRLLARMHKSGARLLASGLMMKKIIEEIEDAER